MFITILCPNASDEYVNRSPCAVCDRLTLVREQRSISADQLPNEGLLRACDKLNQLERARITFTDYPGDTKKSLKISCLATVYSSILHPFYSMHIGKKCYGDLNRGVMPCRNDGVPATCQRETKQRSKQVR